MVTFILGKDFFKMIREVIDDALARGERLKKDIIAEIVTSATLQDLINNKAFIDTVAKVIHTKHEVVSTIRQNVQEALRVMKIPSRSQIQRHERRVLQLEKQLDQLNRRMILKKANARKKTHKKIGKMTLHKNLKKR
ncbi:MAG: hypothetical protein A3F89_05410 [Deltaproteobacteria bacterium RIFCSPLOWO2_12_FULL_50_11]|nr:MAG: hypothetical protein A2053_05700 [Deltaproteobacteria bacterium GWA2_50_8]OGQ31490.1 MAG: hypothetical protein A3B79_00155 [Deltaproteobacteria bacterium RIFCSPHIGHO2_02_FULL_50_15]OGQ68575.1 MAG: hypothetical protein A3F89_05410 [Deltaproteobacteria bacterium RIFCSPLOWO2_12_FULL_50_11]